MKKQHCIPTKSPTKQKNNYTTSLKQQLGSPFEHLISSICTFNASNSEVDYQFKISYLRLENETERGKCSAKYLFLLQCYNLNEINLFLIPVIEGECKNGALLRPFIRHSPL